jgi:hypothetical protein
MKPNPNSQVVVDLYVQVMQRPMSQRYNVKQLIFDVVPAKRLLYQVFMPDMRTYEQPDLAQVDQLSAHDLRFINFLESTDFTPGQCDQIIQAHATLQEAVPDQYKYRAPIQSKAFAFYGRKFGRQPIVTRVELDQLYEGHGNEESFVH